MYFYAIWPIQEEDLFRFIFLLALGLGLLGVVLVRPLLKKKRLAQQLALPFPEAYRKILANEVPYYQDLSEAERLRFEEATQYFLATTQITGVNVEVDDQVRVLVAASAVIPVFGFQDWTYRNLNEVLIYPRSFNSATYAQQGEGRETLGMVGTGPMAGKMILSKPALINGFRRQSDGLNTGIHEFVHLLDGSDGEFDGIPDLIDKKYVLPWLGLMHREMKRINKGGSRLRPYGATNKAEFFAVASEYFFERPKDLKKYYPKLYDLLRQLFKQDL